MKFNLKISEIKAALIICSKDENRYVLCGINVELAPNKAPLIVATDGRRLIAIDSRAEQDEPCDKKQSVIISSEALKKVLKLCTRFCDFVCFEANAEKKSLEALILGSDRLTIYGAVVDGNFPAWRQVIPKEGKRPVGEVGFNTLFLADFGKASVLLGNDSGALKLRMNDGGALLVRSSTVGNFLGVLMPCVIEIEQWMPLWVGLDEKPKSAEPATPEPAKQREPAMA